MAYETKIPSAASGEHLSGTECGHKHQSLRAAVKCSRHRNPYMTPGTLIVDVVQTDGVNLTEDELYEMVALRMLAEYSEYRKRKGVER